jgi:hypothetical protein
MTHTTKHGNTYTDQEWSDMQAGFKAQDEADDAIETKIDGMIRHLVSQCVKFGFSEGQAQTVAQLFRTAEYLEANIQFSSKKNWAFVEDMWVRFDKAMSKLN